MKRKHAYVNRHADGGNTNRRPKISTTALGKGAVAIAACSGVGLGLTGLGQALLPNRTSYYPFSCVHPGNGIHPGPAREPTAMSNYAAARSRCTTQANAGYLKDYFFPTSPGGLFVPGGQIASQAGQGSVRSGPHTINKKYYVLDAFSLTTANRYSHFASGVSRRSF